MCTIAPSALLDPITEAVVIDGYTQPGASLNTLPFSDNAVLKIVLDATSSTFGLLIGSDGSTVRGLVVGEGVAGLSVQGTGNTIAGNFVGTDVSGLTAVPNSVGVSVGGPGNVIGGSSLGDRNVISGNNEVGIILSFTAGAIVQGNFIGIDASGAAPVPNGVGIHCDGCAGDSIGGAAAGAGNIISGNPIGIQIVSSSGTATAVLGNRIGTDASGAFPVGNTGLGIHVGQVADIAIGGTGPGEANVIAFNGIDGGVVIRDGAVRARIRGNSIHDNGGLGIDLVEFNTFGPTANYPGDADTGSNNHQNFPVIQSVEHLGPEGNGSTRVVGKLNSAPSTTFDLDFYSNPACSNFPREFIEGETYLGSSQVTTDGSGTPRSTSRCPSRPKRGADLRYGHGPRRQHLGVLTADHLLHHADLRPGYRRHGPHAIRHRLRRSHDADRRRLPGHRRHVHRRPHADAATPAFRPGTVHDVVATTPDGTTGTLVKGWVADFLDVPGGHQFHSFVTTLVSNGITAGVGGGNYGVDQPTLRQQMAVFLLKAKHGLCYMPPACTGDFPDVPCPSTFAAWIEALAAEGITGGCGGGNYCPTNPVRRDQMAVFLLKAKHGSSYVPPPAPAPSTT